jgi:hypothetical protein
MNIKYRIISVDEASHSFVVRYFTDTLSEFDLIGQFESEGKPLLAEDGTPARCRSDVNLTMYKTDATSEEIDTMIQQAAPAEWLRLLSDVKANTATNAMSLIKNKMTETKEFVHVPPAPVIPPVEVDVATLIENLKAENNA